MWGNSSFLLNSFLIPFLRAPIPGPWKGSFYQIKRGSSKENMKALLTYLTTYLFFYSPLCPSVRPIWRSARGAAAICLKNGPPSIILWQMSSEPAVLPGTQLSDSHQGGRVRGQADRLRPLQVQVKMPRSFNYFCALTHLVVSHLQQDLWNHRILFSIIIIIDKLNCYKTFYYIPARTSFLIGY